jgi:hypothetical protein
LGHGAQSGSAPAALVVGKLELMPRTHKVVTPKGQRYPGSGVKKGYVKPVTVEARMLVTQLVNDAGYQARLRRDFALRRLHPTIEALVWAYALGKPKQELQLSGSIDIHARIEEERRIFAQLDLPELEALAARSQALIDEATATVQARNGGELPQDVVVEAEVVKTTPETLEFSAGSDNGSCVNPQAPSDETPIAPMNAEDNTDGEA